MLPTMTSSPDPRPLPDPPIDASTERSVASGAMIDDAPSTRRVLVAVAIALALIVVAILVGRALLRTDAEVHPEFRFVVAGLDTGTDAEWRPVAAKDQGVNTGPPFPGAAIVLLGTAGDPTRAAIELVWRTDDGAPGYESLAASTGMAPLDTVTGRPTACADQADGTVLCYVEERQRGLQLRASQVPLDEIRQVVDALSFVDDQPRLDTDRLPADLQQLAAGRLGSTRLVPNGNADHPGISSVLYVGPAEESALLVVGDAARQEPASSGVTMQWDRRTVGDQVYFVSGGDGSAYAMWRRDGKAFWLRRSNDDVDGVLALAATVRPATAVEWAAIPVRPRYDGVPIVTG